MDKIIIFSATYLVYVSILYTIFYLFWNFKNDKKVLLKDLLFLFVTAAFSWVIAHFLKTIIAHPRPDPENAIIAVNDIYSLPSGHASFMFALAFAMNYFSFGAGFILLLLAVITGFARVLAGVHFSYDIMAGAVLGYIISLIFIYLYERFLMKI